NGMFTDHRHRTTQNCQTLHRRSRFGGRCQWVLYSVCQIGEWLISHCGPIPPSSEPPLTTELLSCGINPTTLAMTDRVLPPVSAGTGGTTWGFCFVDGEIDPVFV